MCADADAVIGCLLGQAVADALGLPREGLSPRRARKLFPHADRHAFLFGRGLFSDDTEHACLVGQALLTSGGKSDVFQRDLARRLRWWFAALPAGVGKATLLSCLKLWMGVPPNRSGVYSAGNGPAMRAALLGVCLGDTLEQLGAFVRASTRITHTDPKAEYGAFAVAWAAHRSAASRGGPPPRPRDVVEDLKRMVKGDKHSAKLFDRLDAVVLSVEAGQTPHEFAETMDMARGVGGFIYHTVPVAFHAWLKYPDDYRTAVQEVIRCGGDTDTVAAVTGALVGVRVGPAGIPLEWMNGIIDRPRSVKWVLRLGERVAAGAWRTAPQPPVPLAVWQLPFRNAAFLLVVLAHGFRRLLPPY